MIVRNMLVTGGAGFIGSNFIRNVLSHVERINIVNLDLLTYAGSLENLRSLPREQNYTFVKGDVRDEALVKTILIEYEIDTIVHFAAETHVDRSISAPADFITTNINGTFNMLESARRVWMSKPDYTPENYRFHHISTDEVYGTLASGEPSFEETTPYAPNSPYAASKASSDHLVRAYHETYKLPVTISNCSNNYGPYQFPEKLIPLMILNALKGEPLPIYGDGRQIRDWLYVEDHCEAIWQIVCNGKIGESYNIGGDNQPTNLEVVRHICLSLDKKKPAENGQPYETLITYVVDRPGHDRRYAMNIKKINRELGWQPNYSLYTGLDKTIDWYLSNFEWIAKINQNEHYQEWIDAQYRKRN